MIKKFFISMLVFFCATVSTAFAQYGDNLKFDGYIADEANIIKEEARENLNLTIDELNKKTGAAIAIVTAPSLQGGDVEATSKYIFNTYEIGSSEKRNGVVMLIAMEERRINIYLDLGYDNKLNSNEVGELVTQNLVPYFDNSEYEQGTVRTVHVLADRIAKIYRKRIKHYGYIPKMKNADGKKASAFNPNWLWLLLIPFGAIIAVVAISALKKGNNNNNKDENS